MKISKKIAAVALVAFAAVCPTWAATSVVTNNATALATDLDVEDFSVYTSTGTGLRFFIPNVEEYGIAEQQDKRDAVIVGTPDNEFVVSAIPFDADDVSEEDIADAVMTMAKAAKIDLSKAKMMKDKSGDKTMEYNAWVGAYGNGGAGIVTLATVIDKKSPLAGHCFLLTIIASPNYTEFAGAVLGSLSFDVENIE